jgi:SAM-dependent methyltransferase
MDEITSAVRAMYEKYPYPPAATPQIRVGSDARMLLSYGKLARKKGRPLQVLDAGCGRAAGLVGAAAVQRDVHFTGIDLNRVALDEAGATLKARGLTNVKLQAVNLMTLEGLDVPEGGFDVIVSSGVLHHLSSPAEGLAKLKAVLAPHGMISLMVYGREGRHALYRTVRALDLVVPRTLPLEERLDAARHLVRAPQAEALFAGPFSDAPTVADAELVDRYLHVHETSYTVRELYTLIEEGGMKPLRWNEPEIWDTNEVLPEALRERASKLSAIDRYSLVEAVAYRPMLDLVVGHAENALRPEISPAAIDDAMLAVSPDVSFTVETRSLRGVRPERVVVKRRRKSMVFSAAPLAAAVLVLRDQSAPFRGTELIKALAGFGVSARDARAVGAELLRTEVLYAPHPADC